MRGLFRRIALVTSGVLLLQGLASGVASASSKPVLKWSPSASGAFSYGTVSSGRSLSQVFTLTNTGKRATGSLSVKLTGSATFAVTKDTCTRVGLRPHRTCKVTVAFAPQVNGQVSAGTLTAASTKPAVKASLTLQARLRRSR